jgi:peptidyl-tRNA hydrolase
MNIYELGDKEEIADVLIQMMEQQTQKKVFTLRVIGENDATLETVVVFDDKSVLKGKIFVQNVKGKLACRIQGNFI